MRISARTTIPGGPAHAPASALKNTKTTSIRTGLWTLCVFFYFSVEAFAHGAFTAPPSAQLTTGCTIQSVSGNFSLAQATYTVQGNCEVDKKDPDPKGGSTFPYPIDYLSWKAVGTFDSTTHAAMETVNIWRNDPGQIVATYTAGMTCLEDPWREAGLTCSSITFQKRGSLGSYDNWFNQDFYTTNTLVPLSSMLTSQQRAALNQEYSTALAALRGTATPNNLGGVDRSAAILSAPIIILPRAESHVVEGQFQVKGTIENVKAPLQGNENVYLFFTCPTTSYTNQWPVALKDFLNGITVPAYITRGGYGCHWQVRAQLSSPTGNGPLGVPITFYLDKLATIPLNPNRSQHLR
ncbi:MAG TPA: hypothetical protein VJ746_11780 [Nitrospira sp.]|nr:hypothetical protein [Nitrospira sp.]